MGKNQRRFRRRTSEAFTLVEILIVVILLGVLAAIVIPRIGSASEEAKIAALMADLKTVRQQIQLYEAQHEDDYPTKKIVNQLTQYSNTEGKTKSKPTAGYPYGPYLNTFPKNPISGSDKVKVENRGDKAFAPPTRDRGWWYNAETGEFRANLTDEHTDANGTPLNQL